MAKVTMIKRVVREKAAMDKEKRERERGNKALKRAFNCASRPEKIVTDRGTMGDKGCVSVSALQVILVAVICYIRASGTGQNSPTQWTCRKDRVYCKHSLHTQYVFKDHSENRKCLWPHLLDINYRSIHRLLSGCTSALAG